jgi:signal transduction histidine kinase
VNNSISIKIYLRKITAWLKVLWHRRALWLRYIFCWGIGCFILLNDEVNSYDQRLRLRGAQRPNSEIIILTLSEAEINLWFTGYTPPNQPLVELSKTPDSYYWHKKSWKRLLEILLKHKPAAIGVSLYFGDNIAPGPLTSEEKSIFQNPKVVWLSTLYQSDYPILPVFYSKILNNTGIGEVTRDEDGKIRRVQTQIKSIPYFPILLSEKLNPKSKMNELPKLQKEGKTELINFRGPADSFPHYRLSEVMSEQLPTSIFENKIVIIGSEVENDSKLITSSGAMSRVELLAHITDNYSQDRWIHRLPYFVYAIGLLTLLMFSVFIVFTYPQSIAFIFLLFLSLLILALSVWLFDSFYIWVPAISPIVQTLITWIIFEGYNAARIEKNIRQLNQERKTLNELEQLKNNFISLISHDLKTPIAKIQAIVDRLLTSQQSDSTLTPDLKTLRNSSNELHKYIQSILKLLRVESRDFKIQKEVVDVNELLESAIEKLNPLAFEKNVTIDVQLEPMFSVEFDSTLMLEVFTNVIENAIKYTPSGGQIKVESVELDDEILISIEDNGEGISAEDLETVFRKFVRGKNQELKSKGTGLGLYLVKYFTELHGGKVTLTSQVNKGTKVTLTLPTVINEESE